MITKQKLRDILQDTIHEYAADPSRSRAILEDSRCSYDTPDHRRCAVGRLLTEDEIKDLRDRHQLTRLVTIIKDVPSIAHLPLFFLRDLQALHDSESNWDFKEGGLTEGGILSVARILNEIEDWSYGI